MKLYILRTETKENRYQTWNFVIFGIDTRTVKIHINMKPLKLPKSKIGIDLLMTKKTIDF